MKYTEQASTTEFKELAVKRIKDGQSVSKVCKELGLSDQTLLQLGSKRRLRELSGAGGKVVTAEEMASSRRPAQNSRLKRELDHKKSGGVLCKGCSVKYAWISPSREMRSRSPNVRRILTSASVVIAPGSVVQGRSQAPLG